MSARTCPDWPRLMELAPDLQFKHYPVVEARLPAEALARIPDITLTDVEICCDLEHHVFYAEHTDERVVDALRRDPLVRPQRVVDHGARRRPGLLGTGETMFPPCAPFSKQTRCPRCGSAGVNPAPPIPCAGGAVRAGGAASQTSRSWPAPVVRHRVVVRGHPLLEALRRRKRPSAHWCHRRGRIPPGRCGIASCCRPTSPTHRQVAILLP